MAQLTDGIQFLKGIGPAKAKLFEALGIHTIGDLLYHYPRTYEDRTRLAPIASLEVDQPACFRAMVMTSPRTSYIRKGLEITKVTVADHSARLNLTFFNQKHVAERLQYGREYIFYGAVSGDFIGYNMTNPAFEAPEEAPLVTRRILPVYPLTAGLTNKTVSKAGSSRRRRLTGPFTSLRMPKSWRRPGGGWYLRSFLYFPPASASCGPGGRCSRCRRITTWTWSLFARPCRSPSPERSGGRWRRLPGICAGACP